MNGNNTTEMVEKRSGTSLPDRTSQEILRARANSEWCLRGTLDMTPDESTVREVRGRVE
jgi:hypothetical protein